MAPRTHTTPKNKRRKTGIIAKNVLQRTKRKDDSKLAPQTRLGQDLLRLRARIVASGEELLDWDGVHRELMSRRGRIEPDE